MNEFVGFVGAPDPIWNSLILIGLTLRTFRTAVSVEFAQRALARMSPLKAAGPLVTLNVVLTLEPGATLLKDAAPLATAVQRAGTARLSATLDTAAPVVFVKVTVVSCEEFGENVCSVEGKLTRATSYFAATTFA